MLYVWFINGSGSESQQLHSALRQSAAWITEQPLDCRLFSAVDETVCALLAGGVPQLACLDLGLAGALALARQIRSKSRTAFLVVVAPADLSPMEYLRPDILAGGLLLRPFTRQQADEVLRGALAACVEKQADDPCACYWIESRGEQQAVPYHSIRYFEALSKRVSLVTDLCEYRISDTLDHLEHTLPAEFIRCHRAFIVRRSCIRRVQLSMNCLELDDGKIIPLSRTYKPKLKGLST